MTGAQRGDFVSPPASSPTDRRDADDAISLERLTRRTRLDNPAIPRDLGPAAGMWARSVTEVQVTYHREPGHERGDWLTDEVTLVGSDGAVMQREVDTLQRGHRTEGVFATLRWRRKPRLSRWDLGLETLPAWLDELVEAYRPPARSAAIAELAAPGTECRHVGKRGLDCDCDEPASGADQPTLRDRYWQCDDTCTVDCGACKGQGRPTLRDQLAEESARHGWEAVNRRGATSLYRCKCGYVPPESLAMEAHRVDVLLPLMEADRERAKAEAAAEALEEAATDAGLPGVFPSTQRWLLARAAALRSNAGGDRS